MTNADMARNYLLQAKEILQEAHGLNLVGVRGILSSDGHRKWLSCP